MANRVSATISIGGDICREDLPTLCRAIELDGASIEWGGPPFEMSDLPDEGPLVLVAHEVAHGCFEEIEDCCRSLGLNFVRWHDGFSGSFSPSRTVFRGKGFPEVFLTTSDDEIVLSATRILALGTIAAIEREIDCARFQPPPLVVVDGPGKSVCADTTAGPPSC